MLSVKRVRESVASAGQSVTAAMKVAVLACLLAVISVVVSLACMSQTRSWKFVREVTA